MLKVKEKMSFREKRNSIQAALLMGFQSESAVFPVASSLNGDEYGEEKTLSCLLAKFNKPGANPQNYIPASDAAKPIPDFDFRPQKGLESMFGIGQFLCDHNLDLLPDQLNFHMVVPENSSPSIMIAACNFAFRFGMETTGFTDWLLVPEYQGGNAIIFKEGEKPQVCWSEETGDTIVSVEGSGSELESFSSWFCENFPYDSLKQTWASRLGDMTDSFTMKNLEGQLAYLKHILNEAQGAVQAFVSPEIEQKRSVVEKLFPEVEFINFKEKNKRYEKEYDIPWEVDVFGELFEKKVLSKVKPGDKVEIVGALSEDRVVRKNLEEEVRGKLARQDIEVLDLNIFCAYKQGFSWIQESVIPKLKEQIIGKIVIAFRPFLPDGVTEWNDVNGATPSYNNLGGDPDQWYDLPIRYLQELYPIADVLVQELGIEKEQIEFITYEGDQDITYECCALTESGKRISCDVYKAANARRPYLDAYPGMGKVHPSTGYLCVKVNGQMICEERIQTDVEMIWDVYQKEVLKDCRKFVEEKSQGQIRLEDQPFFSQLKLEVIASEPDERLDSREDLISTLDGLHEDMYFAGTDYFKNFGNECCGQMLEEPGLILPVIKKGEGRPFFKVTLYDQAADAPVIKDDGRVLAAVPERQNVKVYIEAVSKHADELQTVIRIEGVDERVVQAYAKVLEEMECSFGEKQKLVFKIQDSQYAAELKAKKLPEKNLDIHQIDLMENQLIGYEDYLIIIEKLKRVPGLLVYRTAVSYMGREVYAIELLPDQKGYVSRVKRLTNYPSEIINCRHHANEVSSTNAAFILLRTLLTDEKYREVSEKLNLVIVPMENVDGAAIHYELQKENPYWKLHVARFNAVGKEFYYEHFKADTKHTEALSLTRLFERFLPDIIVDNHGVPSHEWDQQFSGYTSPSYKGFWLPRSLLYGYFWCVSDPEYQSNEKVNKKIEDVIADAIGEEDEMRQWNREWAYQFKTYAHQWMPKLFPANYYKEMINYWIPFAADVNHRYPSIRFPWITAVAYTSEVADETAQGEYLNLCARAHVKHDLAIIELLMKATCVYENQAILTEDEMNVSHRRLRPIAV